MFNDLNPEAKQRFFGTRKVVSTTTVDGMVIIQFDEATETVTQAEFEAGVTEQPVDKPADRQKHFVARTTALRTEVGQLLQRHNPRYWEFHKLIQWIGEGISEGYNEAVSRLFGVTDFEGQVTFDKLCEFLDEKHVDYSSDLSEVEKALLDVLCTKKVTLHEVLKNVLFPTLQKKLEAQVDLAVNKAFGIEDEVLRMEDIDIILRKSHVEDKKTGEEQPAVEAHTDGRPGEELQPAPSEDASVSSEKSSDTIDPNPS